MKETEGTVVNDFVNRFRIFPFKIHVNKYDSPSVRGNGRNILLLQRSHK